MLFTTNASVQTGIGYATGHHGELLQGVTNHKSLDYKQFLVSLPRLDIQSQAKFTPLKDFGLQVIPDWKSKSLKAAELTLAYVGCSQVNGLLQISSNIKPCLGFGSSTCDVVASIRAVAHACKRQLTAAEISCLAVQAEVACDPCMYDNMAVVYLQREGIVKEYFSRDLPAIVVLGFNPCLLESGVATLDLPLPVYTKTERKTFNRLLNELKSAITQQSASLLGKVCIESAIINQRYLPKPYFAELLEIQKHAGACGIQVAHSGSIVGFVFDAEDHRLYHKIFIVKQLLNNLGIIQTWQFSTGKKRITNASSCDRIPIMLKGSHLDG